MDEYQMHQLGLCFMSAIYAREYNLWFVWMHAKVFGNS